MTLEPGWWNKEHAMIRRGRVGIAIQDAATVTVAVAVEPVRSQESSGR